MIRNGSILTCVLAIAMIVYCVVAAGLLRRTFAVLCAPICLHSHSRSHEEPGPGGLPPCGPAIVNIHGVPVHLSVLICAALTVPGMLIANDIACWNRRRRRDRLNQCIECGYPIRSWRGRCPGCGIRIGPG